MSTEIPLPGLEQPSTPPGTLEAAVRRTLAALPDEARTDAQAARMALALELAQVITVKRITGRASTIGNDARVLVELLDKLVPAPTEGTDTDDMLREALARWGDEIERMQPPRTLAEGEAP